MILKNLQNMALASALAVIGVFAAAGSAVAEYPDKPVTMYIGYKAGGGTDTVGRVIAKILGEQLGQQINVVNKPGAGGGIAVMTLQRANADGYTLLMNPSGTISTAPQINEKLTYTVDDFDYIGMATAFQIGLVAPADRPYDDLAGFVAYAKANPGAKYATLNPASKMVMDYLAAKEGLDVNYVPVKGGAGMINVVLGNQVDMGYSGGIHQRHPEKIKLIGALSSERHAAAPNVSTFQESGYPLVINMQTTLVAPKGTPADVIAKLEAALAAAATHPDLISISEKVKFPITYKNTADATAEMKSQWDAFADMIEETSYSAN
jgi:tripartite-type tricarboxylate transporter receptor subunit TctC